MTGPAGTRGGLPRVLCVDDEPRILTSLERLLRRHFDVTVAGSGDSALAFLAASDPFAVIMSDMKMPGMDGITFLDQARRAAPDSVRILLTGNADVDAAVRAVNDGQLFRFLCKPSSDTDLVTALSAGVDQHRLIVAERELLEETLQGSIGALLGVLSLANPLAFARATRIKELVSAMVAATRPPDPWQIEVAAMLSQIGAVTLPDPVAARLNGGGELSGDEQAMVDRLPSIAEDMLVRIPRLEAVREIIRSQHRDYDRFVDGRRARGPSGDAIPLGARMLRIAIDVDHLESRGVCRADALSALERRHGVYDPELLATLRTEGTAGAASVEEVALEGLEAGMVLVEDVEDNAGMLLIGRGQTVTDSLIERLRNWSTVNPVAEPIVVRRVG